MKIASFFSRQNFLTQVISVYITQITTLVDLFFFPPKKMSLKWSFVLVPTIEPLIKKQVNKLINSH